MKTNILITLALVMGMMLTGCSKEESENMEINNTEQVYLNPINKVYVLEMISSDQKDWHLIIQRVLELKDDGTFLFVVLEPATGGGEGTYKIKSDGSIIFTPNDNLCNIKSATIQDNNILVVINTESGIRYLREMNVSLLNQ